MTGKSVRNSVAASVPVLRGHLPALLLTASVPTLICVLWLVLRPPLYESTLYLSIGPMTDDDSAALNPAVTPIELATLSELFHSAALLRLASQSLALDDHREYQRRSRGQEQYLRARLFIEPVNGTRLLKLRFRAEDPVLTTTVLNTLAASYSSWVEDQYHRFVESEALSIQRTLQLLLGAPAVEISHADDLNLLPELPYLPVGNDLSDTGELESAVSRLLEQTLVDTLMAGFRSVVARQARISPIESADEPVNIRAGFLLAPPLTVYVISLFFAGLALLIHYRTRSTVSLPDELLRLTPLPLVATLPAVSGSGIERLMQDMSLPDDPRYAEAVRHFRTALCLRTRKQRDRQITLMQEANTVLITSSADGEGKSSVALALALSLGQIDRVLLINADLRAPEAEFCGLSPKAPGLSHLIAGAAPLRHCIHSFAQEGIDVIPAGIRAPNPQELLSSKRFVRIMEVLRHRYSYVIVDGPACGTESDLELLKPHCRELLFVVRADHTRKKNLMATLGGLSETVDCNVRLVLNGVDVDTAARFGFSHLFPQVQQGRGYGYHKPGGRYLID